MKAAFISDIHGNHTALQAVLKDIEARQVERLFVLGDLCYRGIRPKESLKLVQSLQAEVIKGNADEWVVRGIHPREVPETVFSIMNREREWIKERLDEDDLRYLASLPHSLTVTLEGVKIHAFHATPRDLFEVTSPDMPDELMKEKLMVEEADVYIYGHIHKAFVRYIDGKTVINLGSVGLPFDGVTKASYALLEMDRQNVQTSIIKVAYDTERVLHEIKDSDYPNKDFLQHVLMTGRP
jgi:putative phosphoesterase